MKRAAIPARSGFAATGPAAGALGIAASGPAVGAGICASPRGRRRAIRTCAGRRVAAGGSAAGALSIESPGGNRALAPAVPRRQAVPLPRCDYGPQPGDPSRPRLGSARGPVNLAGGQHCGQHGDRSWDCCGHPWETSVNCAIAGGGTARCAAPPLPTGCGQRFISCRCPACRPHPGNRRGQPLPARTCRSRSCPRRSRPGRRNPPRSAAGRGAPRPRPGRRPPAPR